MQVVARTSSDNESTNQIPIPAHAKQCDRLERDVIISPHLSIHEAYKAVSGCNGLAHTTRTVKTIIPWYQSAQHTKAVPHLLKVGVPHTVLESTQYARRF